MSWLQGKKTYIVAGVTIIATWAAYLIGAPVTGVDHVPTMGEVLSITVTAILGMTIRSGITTEIQKNG